MSTPRVIIPLPDYGGDPSETAVPYVAFKKAGFEVQFATEHGAAPQCDKRMLEGITQKLLGATGSTVKTYKEMAVTPEFQHPLSWTAPDFSLEPYNLVFIPGGHEKSVRQIIDSKIMQKHIASYFPQTKKPSSKTVGAICHGVMLLSETEGADGKSVIYECTTTALPARFEQVAFWGTRLFLGDYYKTYGAGSDDVEEAKLKDPKTQFKNSLAMSPFVVQDETHNYITARFPVDVHLLAEQTIALVKKSMA